MAYYGPRVGVGPIEHIGQRIADAFLHIERKPLREAEKRAAKAEARTAEREADVYGARAYEYGITPEGAERVPEEKDTTAAGLMVGPGGAPLFADRSMRIEGQERPAGDLSDTAREGMDLTGRLAGAFTGLPSVEGGLREISPEAETGAQRLERGGGGPETQGLPPGDVRAPLGTPPPGAGGDRRQPSVGVRGTDRAGGLNQVVQEGRPAGIRLESGSVYRPQPSERDQLVNQLMRAYPGMSRAKAEIASDRRLGQTALSDYVDRRGGGRPELTGGQRTDRATTQAVRLVQQEGYSPMEAAEIVGQSTGVYPEPKDVRSLTTEEEDETPVSSRQREADYIYTQARNQGASMQEAAEQARQQAGIYPDVGEYQQYRHRRSRPERELVDRYGMPRLDSWQVDAFRGVKQGLPPDQVAFDIISEIGRLASEAREGVEPPPIQKPGDLASQQFQRWQESLPEPVANDVDEVLSYLSPDLIDLLERRREQEYQ